MTMPDWFLEAVSATNITDGGPAPALAWLAERGVANENLVRQAITVMALRSDPDLDRRVDKLMNEDRARGVDITDIDPVLTDDDRHYLGLCGIMLIKGMVLALSVLEHQPAVKAA